MKTRTLSSFSIVLAALFFLCPCQSQAQEKESSGKTGPKFIGTQIVEDIIYLAGEKDFFLVVGGIGLAPSIAPTAFRHETPELTRLWGPSASADNFFELGEIAGDGKFPVCGAIMTWGIGKLAGSSRMTAFGTDLLRAQAVNGLFTASIKVATHRTRPDNTAYSFPSGHTSSAFATAGIVYSHFGKKWGIPAFITAGYIGMSRLQEGKHYLSDVVAGGVLGTYLSLKIANRRNRTSSLSISPYEVNDGAGLSFRFRF